MTFEYSQSTLSISFRYSKSAASNPDFEFEGGKGSILVYSNFFQHYFLGAKLTALFLPISMLSCI